MLFVPPGSPLDGVRGSPHPRGFAGWARQPVNAQQSAWYDEAMEVLAFGITAENANWGIAGHKIISRAITQPSLSFGDAHLVIVTARVKLSADSTEHTRATGLLVNQIFAAAKSGQLICVVYNEDNPAAGDFISARVLERLGARLEPFAPSLARVYADEFSDYLSVYGVQGFVFEADKALMGRLQPVAGSTDEGFRVSAFAVAEGQGLIYIVPGNIVSGSESKFISALASAIEAHASGLRSPTTAAILQSFVFSQEAKIRENREAILTELGGLDTRIAEYEARKDILFLRDDPLADAVPIWITKHLGLRTARQEEYIEDFWILDRNGEKVAICEAKGLDKNVQRKHIAALVLHRDERELPDSYPSVLVVNTFADAKTEIQKGKQRVGARECRKAVRDHVLVIRTLDLMRLLDQLDRKVVSERDISKLLTAATGWLKVGGDSREVVGT